MTAHSSHGSPRRATKSSIRTVEHRISDRREAIGSTMKNIVRSARDQIISPASLITAGLLGVALQRSDRFDGLRILAILQSAHSGLRLLLAAGSKTGDEPN